PPTLDRTAARPDVRPHRCLDEVDHLRAAMLLLAAAESVRTTTSIREHVLDAYADFADDGVVLRPLDDLLDDASVQCELQGAADLLLIVEYDGETVEVDPTCIAWQQSLEGTPETSWARFCATCRATHLY